MIRYTNYPDFVLKYGPDNNLIRAVEESIHDSFLKTVRMKPFQQMADYEHYLEVERHNFFACFDCRYIRQPFECGVTRLIGRITVFATEAEFILYKTIRKIGNPAEWEPAFLN